MDKIPTDVKKEICAFAFRCKSDYIPINREFSDILSEQFQKCSEMNVLNKTLCRVCDKQTIRDVNMIFQCYLPLYR